MKLSMRLFQRGGWFHVEFYRGKTKSLKTKDHKKAEALFREIEKEFLRGRLFNLENVRRCTLSEFTKIYSQTRAGISPWTIKKDDLSLKLLQDVVGNIQIRALTNPKLDEFKRVCLARGAKPITINGYLRHIKAALTYALDEGYIEKKPKIKMLPVNKNLPRVLDPDQINSILDGADEDFRRLLKFYLWTGARRREALRLNWQDISLEKGFCLFRNTKGKQDRKVPLTKELIEEMLPFKRDLGPVFPQIHPDTISHTFNQIAKGCGVDARLHDLRHSACTYMLKSGIPIQVVKEILGHAQISTTLIYTHVLDDIKYEEMKKLRFE
jgi:integrase